MRRPSASVGLSALLVVVVVVAAGLIGAPHFGGPRLAPHVKIRTPGSPDESTIPAQTLPLSPTQQSSPSPARTVSAVWAILVVVGLACLVGAWLIRRWWLNRRQPPTGSLTGSPSIQPVQGSAPLPPPEPEVLLTGIEIALRALEEERDPGDAIVRAWLGLEETARQSGIQRGPSQTPTEFTSQIMRAAFADDRAISTLLRLYLRTRFSEHPVSADDVTAVGQALAQLLDNWRLSDRRTVARAR